VGTDPCDELHGRNRLDQVVIGADIETSHPVRFVGCPGDQDDGQSRRGVVGA